MRLFLRSTHGLSLTEAGRAYTEHLTRWLTAEDEIRDGLGGGARTRGAARCASPCRCSSPSACCRRWCCASRASTPACGSTCTPATTARPGHRRLRSGDPPRSAARFDAARPPRWSASSASSALRPRSSPRTARRAIRPRWRALPCLLYGNGTQPVAVARSATRAGRSRRVEVNGPLRSNNLDPAGSRSPAGRRASPACPTGRCAHALADRRGDRDPDRLVARRVARRPALWAVHAADPGKDRLRRDFLATLLAEIGAAGVTRAAPRTEARASARDLRRAKALHGRYAALRVGRPRLQPVRHPLGRVRARHRVGRGVRQPLAAVQRRGACRARRRWRR